MGKSQLRNTRSIKKWATLLIYKFTILQQLNPNDSSAKQFKSLFLKRISDLKEYLNKQMNEVKEAN
jgi:hypothetical protein